MSLDPSARRDRRTIHLAAALTLAAACAPRGADPSPADASCCARDAAPGADVAAHTVPDAAPGVDASSGTDAAPGADASSDTDAGLRCVDDAAGDGGGGVAGPVTPVACTHGAGDAHAIQTALDAAPPGGIVALSGTCDLGGTSVQLASHVTLRGPATLLYTGGAYAIQSTGSDDTVTGLVFDGGGIDLSLNDTTTWTAQSGWTITDNTFQNITNGADGVHVENILGKGAPSTISRNTFTNIWAGGFGHYAAGSPPGSSGFDPAGSGIYFHMGLDNATLDANTFDQIGYNAIKGFWDGFLGHSHPYMGHDVVISNNVMTRVRRIGIEVQAAGQGACPGGCDYNLIAIDRLTFKGNYYHAPYDQQDNFGFSIMAAATHSLMVNNTAVTENPTCYWPLGIAFENSLDGGTFQGNVMGSVHQSCAGNYNDNHGWAAYVVSGYTGAAYTNTFQNNVACGEHATSFSHDPYDSATHVERYDFVADACPAGDALATSAIHAAFTSPDDQRVTASATWSVAVVSNLSIRDVRFFVDDAACPQAVQEVQDVDDQFATDRAWRYHATLDLSALAPGAHTIRAVATDVAGTTQAAHQAFTR